MIWFLLFAIASITILFLVNRHTEKKRNEDVLRRIKARKNNFGDILPPIQGQYEHVGYSRNSSGPGQLLSIPLKKEPRSPAEVFQNPPKFVDEPDSFAIKSIANEAPVSKKMVQPKPTAPIAAVFPSLVKAAPRPVAKQKVVAPIPIASIPIISKPIEKKVIKKSTSSYSRDDSSSSSSSSYDYGSSSSSSDYGSSSSDSFGGGSSDGGGSSSDF